MSEKCPLREVDSKGYQEINEQYVPVDCIQCLNRALGTGNANVVMTDTYEQALGEMKGIFGSDFDPEIADKWHAMGMRMPGDGPQRQATMDGGFDVFTHSYENETYSQAVTFDCQNE